MELTVAALQAAGVPGDVAANRAQLWEAAGKAAAAGADLLVTTELFLTGYDIGDRVRELAQLDLIGMVQEIARDAKIAILAGLPEPAGSDAGTGTGTGALYNTAVVVDARGDVIARYRKTHLFGELDRRYFKPGDELVSIVELKGVRVAVLICYDVEFPETARAAADSGAELIAVPTAQMTPFAFVAEHVIRTRAWENQVYIAYVNHDGREQTLEYVGRSSIVAPSGDVLASVEHGDHLLLATIDSDVVARARADNPYLADRRPDLY